MWPRLLIFPRYRAACESLSVANFEYASARETEQKLWMAHLKVNTAFRQEHKIVRRVPTRRTARPC
jgi:hypothetical protein